MNFFVFLPTFQRTEILVTKAVRAVDGESARDDPDKKLLFDPIEGEEAMRILQRGRGIESSYYNWQGPLIYMLNI